MRNDVNHFVMTGKVKCLFKDFDEENGIFEGSFTLENIYHNISSSITVLVGMAADVSEEVNNEYSKYFFNTVKEGQNICIDGYYEQNHFMMRTFCIMKD